MSSSLGKQTSMLSIIIPAYNECGSIKSTITEVAKVLKKSYPGKSEIIVVDDGSYDITGQIIDEIIDSWSFKTIDLRYIPLVRNFGKESAVLAGYSESKGDIVGCIDGDGQHPASLIPEMLSLMEQEGTDVVIGVRENQDHKKIGSLSSVFYSMTRFLGDKHTVRYGTDFRFSKRHVVDSFLKLREHGRVNRSLMDWLGYPHSIFEFKSLDRTAGAATYSISKLVKLSLDGIVASGTKPLVAITPVGILLCGLSIIGALLGVIDKYLFSLGLDISVQGYVLLLVILLFGIQFIITGIIALYIGSLFIEVQNRPQYIINSQKDD